MDIEFHYYMTYLIAARAGFAPAEAVIIAHSAQEIDDNHIPLMVGAGTPAAYESVITQTMNILAPLHTKRVYPIFHFIPGDPDAPTARRKDGLRDPWVTTPNSPLANELIDTALVSGNLYRIGASAHSFADTWAHQNFVGRSDIYNEMPDASLGERLESEVALLRIGHALAGHRPDVPALLWSDGRLEHPTIDNTARFLDAAFHLFRKLWGFRHGSTRDSDFERSAMDLLSALRSDIGPSSERSLRHDPARIGRYKLRAMEPAFGAMPIPDYSVAKWSDEAFVEKRAGLVSKVEEFVARHAGMAGDILEFGAKLQFNWLDPDHYRDTNWHKFQEAVKAHLDECWGVIEKRFPESKSTDSR